MGTPKRCAWADGDDALMRAYHDEEWGVPQRDPRALWEVLKAVSKELSRRGFKFVGPTIAQAFLQAVGIINHHARLCFRRPLVEEQAGARGARRGR